MPRPLRTSSGSPSASRSRARAWLVLDWAIGDRFGVAVNAGATLRDTRSINQAVTITDPSELAGAMTEKLVELFDEDVRATQRSGQPGAYGRRRLN